MSVSGLFLVLFLLFHMSMNLGGRLLDGGLQRDLRVSGCQLVRARRHADPGRRRGRASGLCDGADPSQPQLAGQPALRHDGRARRGYVGFAEHVRARDHHRARTAAAPLQLLVQHAVRRDHRQPRAQVPSRPADGAAYIAALFSARATASSTSFGFAAIWFHLTHGFWSAFHTIGWDNQTWLPRLKRIANVVATIVFLCFALVVIVFYLLQPRRLRRIVRRLLSYVSIF